MKRIIVVIFLVCLAFAEWQQSDEITLPKGIQINDLAVSNNGEVWVLTGSSISKIDPESKNLMLVQEVREGRFICVFDDSYYLVDANNKLTRTNPEEFRELNVMLGALSQIGIMVADGSRYVVSLEGGRLIFSSESGTVAAMAADVERFSFIPNADYSNEQTPFFTLSNNRIYAWAGGTSNNVDNYHSRVMYSTSGNILDFAAAPGGKLYVLHADSIVVIENSGNYEGRIRIDNVPAGSRIYANPSGNGVVLFNRQARVLEFFSASKKDKGELIVLNKNRPNPVDNYTEIEFTIKESLNLTLTIYNLIGEPVKVVAGGLFARGTHTAVWNADDEKGKLVPNGIYFYRLETRKGIAIKQLIVLR
jgi:hypothetical protein